MGIYQRYYDSEQVKSARRRLVNAFHCCNTEAVPVWEFSSDPIYPLGRVMSEMEPMLDQLLRNIELTMQYETDYCPVLYPWYGTGVYAEAFGAEIRWEQNDYPWTIPLIHSAAEADRIRPEKPGKSGLTRRVMETIDYFQRRTNAELPITCTDPQSPFSTLMELWDSQDLMMTLYSDPQAVHRMLDMITDYFIAFTQMQIQAIENIGLPGFNFPLGDGKLGISVCDDYASLISADMYREFCIPYLQRISDAYGGLCIHACGNYLHNLPNMMTIRGIKAFNYHCSDEEVTPEKAREIIGGRCAVYTAPSVMGVGFKDGRHKNQQEIYDQYFLPRGIAPHEGNVIMTGFGTYWGSSDVSAVEQTRRYRWINQRMNQLCVAKTLKN